MATVFSTLTLKLGINRGLNISLEKYQTYTRGNDIAKASIFRIILGHNNLFVCVDPDFVYLQNGFAKNENTKIKPENGQNYKYQGKPRSQI